VSRDIWSDFQTRVGKELTIIAEFGE